MSVQDKGIEKKSHLFRRIVFVAIFTAVLRLYQLGTESLWIDEGYSIRDANPIESVSRASKPLYYWILSFWTRLGSEDWLLRLPAVIFGVAAVVVVFLLGKMIWNSRAGMLAALIAAVSPMQVDHSQEIRMYTLLMLMAATSAYFLLLGLENRKVSLMIASGVCLLLAILTHPVACLLLIPFGLFVIDSGRKNDLRIWRYLAVLALVALAWVPWLPHVLGFGTGFAGSWASLEERPSVYQIPLLWTQYGVGEWDLTSSGTKSRAVILAYTAGIILLTFLVVWRERRRPQVRFLAAWLVLPVVALFLLSVIKANAWVTRYLIYTSPALYLLLGAAWARQKRPLGFIILGAFLFLLPSVKLVRYYQKTMRPEWRPAVQYVMDHQRPTDLIGIYRSGNRFVFRHYYHGRARWLPLGPLDFPREQLVGWNEKKAEDLLRSFPPAPRRWLYVAMMPSDAETVIERVLYKRYRVIEFRRYNGIRLYLFEDRGISGPKT